MGLGILDPAVTMGQSEEIGSLDVKASKREHTFNIGYPQMLSVKDDPMDTLKVYVCEST